jgi:2-dehydropantoate 2-reductase
MGMEPAIEASRAVGTTKPKQDAAPNGARQRPLPARPRVAVVGAGAVGGYYGGRLARHGHDVHFLLRGDYDAVRRNGIRVVSCDGDFDLPPGSLNVYDDPGRMPQADLVFITLKATSNDAYARLIPPLLHDETAILTVQNGLGNEDKLGELFGVKRVLGGMAFVCINRAGPGLIRHIDHGMIRLGESEPPGRSPRADSIVALFQAAGVRCEVLEDLRRGRWEKLVWNVPFNGLGAVMDLTTDRLIATEAGRDLVARLMREVIEAARADGAELAAHAGAAERIIQRQIENTRTMGAYMSSMQIDRREGRPMEVEAILGEPLRRARCRGVSTPLLRALYEFAVVVGAGSAAGAS